MHRERQKQPPRPDKRSKMQGMVVWNQMERLRGRGDMD